MAEQSHSGQAQDQQWDAWGGLGMAGVDSHV